GQSAVDLEIAGTALRAGSRAARRRGGLRGTRRARSGRGIARSGGVGDGGRARSARRLVAQRPGNSFRAVAAPALLVAGLLAAHRRLLRVVVLPRLLGNRVIHVGGDRRTHPAGADHGFEQIDDALLIAFFELARV